MFYRLRISPEPEVSLVGHIRYRARWSDSYRHRENILLYIRSGSFRYDFEDGRSYSVSGGGCHMIPAGSAYRVTVTDDCEFSYIHFALASPAEAAGEDEVAEEMTRLKKGQLASRLARNWPDPRPDTLFVPALIDTGEDEEKIRYRFARIDETRNGTYELDRFRTANVFMGLLISLSAAGAARLLREAFGAACEREERDGRGKPRIPGAAAYSVSHSGGWVALAVAGEGVERIGVDIEARALRRRALPEALVRKTMDETEAAAVWASPDPWAEFLRRWVEKEAYVKATGEGVSGGLKDAMHRMASAEGWRVAPAEAPAGVFAAVAWEARGAE